MVSRARDVWLVSRARDVCLVSRAQDVCLVSRARDVCLVSRVRDVCLVSRVRDVCLVSRAPDVCLVSQARDVCLVSRARDVLRKPRGFWCLFWECGSKCVVQTVRLLVPVLGMGLEMHLQPALFLNARDVDAFSRRRCFSAGASASSGHAERDVLRGACCWQVAQTALPHAVYTTLLWWLFQVWGAGGECAVRTAHSTRRLGARPDFAARHEARCLKGAALVPVLGMGTRNVRSKPCCFRASFHPPACYF